MTDMARQLLGGAFASIDSLWEGTHSGVAEVRADAGAAPRRLRWIAADLLRRHARLGSELPERLGSLPRSGRLLPYDEITTIDGHLCLFAEPPPSAALDVFDRRLRTPVAALEMGRDIAAALEALHRGGLPRGDPPHGGLPHGALAPPSLYAAAGSVVIADAGLRVEDEELTKRLGCWACHVRYVSPEQARGGLGGRAADVYAIGCMLVEMLTGKPNVDGATTAMVLYQKLYEPALPQALEGSPAPLRALLEQLLAKDPAARPADATAARATIEAALRELPRHVSGPRPVVVPDLRPAARPVVVPDLQPAVVSDPRPGARPAVVSEPRPGARPEAGGDGTVVEVRLPRPGAVGSPAPGIDGGALAPTRATVARPWLRKHGMQIALMTGAAALGAVAMSWFSVGEPGPAFPDIPPGGALAAPAGTGTAPTSGDGAAAEGREAIQPAPGEVAGAPGAGADPGRQPSAPPRTAEGPLRQPPARTEAAADPTPPRVGAAGATAPPAAARREPAAAGEPPVVLQKAVRGDARANALGDPPITAGGQPPRTTTTDPAAARAADPAAGTGEPDPVADPVAGQGEVTPPPIALQETVEAVAAPLGGAPAAAPEEPAPAELAVVSDPDRVREGDLVPLMPEVVRPTLQEWTPISFQDAALRQLDLSDRTIHTFLLIDENGAVLSGRVLQIRPEIIAGALREGLYREILAQIRSWRFAPATLRGYRVKVWMRVDMEDVFRD